MRETQPGKMKRKLLKGCFFIAGFLLLSAVVMFLWNSLLPQIMHASAINYWQALGLMALCRILFGNFHFGGRADNSYGGGPKQFMKEKLMSMDESDREAFKEEWRKRSERHRRE
jgi:hypothetical protein